MWHAEIMISMDVSVSRTLEVGCRAEHRQTCISLRSTWGHSDCWIYCPVCLSWNQIAFMLLDQLLRSHCQEFGGLNSLSRKFAVHLKFHKSKPL